MMDIDIIKIADEADMIVAGYAFIKCSIGYRILNLNRPTHAIVLSNSGKLLETNMDSIEVQIVKNYYDKNKKFLED